MMTCATTSIPSENRIMRLGLLGVLCLGSVRFCSGFVLAPLRPSLPHRHTYHPIMGRARNSDEEEPDLFEYFDPLLSPHAYPNGVSPDNDPKMPPPQQPEEEDRYNPLRLDSVARASTSAAPSVSSSESANKHPLTAEDVFDPRLSPHAYPNGTPDAIVGSNDEPVTSVVEYRVGVLLMDHGSRNQASNDRLHELARVYQESVGSTYVVRAAHMEIASPSIPQGLENLLQEGVDEIICHPYFLSPFGRHVAEDIPEIVDGAVKELEIDIPIVTTDPIGADTSVMISAIQSVVERQTFKSSD